MGGSTTTQDTQQQSTTQLPPWINDAAQQNYAFAQNVAMQPLQQYQGQMVPDVSPQMQQAWNTSATSSNAGMPQFNAATAGYAGSLGQTPMSVNASTYDPSTYNASTYNPSDYNASTYNATGYNAAQTGSSDLSQYMSPFTQSVINSTLPIMQQQLALSQNQQQNAANSSNAFGGSRQAIQQGVTQAQGAQNMAQMAAQLNEANYNQARAASESDVAAQNAAGQFNAGAQNAAGQYNASNIQSAAAANAAAANAAGQFNAGAQNTAGQFNAGAQNAAGQFNAGAQNTASLANQQAQQAKINSDILASSGLASTGTNLAQAANNAFTMQNTAGSEQMAQAQAAINANQQKFNQAVTYPQTQMGILQSALGMTPYGTSTTGTGQTQTQVPFDWGALATAGVGALGSVFAGKGPTSDRRLKKNLQKVGVHKPTKTPIYAYNWKGEPPGAPKSLGPMAQDLIKTIPGSVVKHPTTGVLHVHPAVHGALARPAPAGTIGVMAMGHPVQSKTQHRRRVRPPQIRGALGG